MGESLNYIPCHALHIFTVFSMCNVEVQFIISVLVMTQCFADINLDLGNVTFIGKGTKLLTAVSTEATVRYLNTYKYFATLYVISPIYYTVFILLSCRQMDLVYVAQHKNNIVLFYKTWGRTSAIPSFHSLIYKIFHWSKFIFIIHVCILFSTCKKILCVTYF
jgi:hypothetical protein